MFTSTMSQEPEFKGIWKHFNGETNTGRANVSNNEDTLNVLEQLV